MTVNPFVQVPVYVVTIETTNQIQECNSTVVKKQPIWHTNSTPNLYIIIQMLFSVFIFFTQTVLQFPFWPLEELFFFLFFWLDALSHMLIWFIRLFTHVKKKGWNKRALYFIVNITITVVRPVKHMKVNNHWEELRKKKKFGANM